MKIAIASTGDNVDCIVAKKFAKCEFFMIYDHNTLESTFITNKAKYKSSGAGKKVAEFLAEQNVDIVLVPMLGPESHKALETFNIKAYEYKQSVTTLQALYDYFAHEYKEVDYL